MSRCVKIAATILQVGRSAIASQAGAERVRAALAARPSRARRLLAIGKAAGSMAAGAVASLDLAERADGYTGLVVTKEAPSIALPAGIVVRLAGHPRPDARSVAATAAALALVASLRPDDELLVLISGGTSALIGGPIPGVSLDACAALGECLQRAGHPIEALNRVRRRLGAALGGRLAAACPAAIRALLLSDVAGDDLRVIGSGPLSAPPLDDGERAAQLAATVGADLSLCEQILRAEPSPAALAARLADARVDAQVLSSPGALADAAVAALCAAGLRAHRAAELAVGPVEAVAARLVEQARALAPGEAFVLVGEPTVVVRGDGAGGRAQHLGLLLAAPLAALGDRAALTLASDGSDGPTAGAGALITSETEALARALGVDLGAAIARFDSHPTLAALSALVRTGPTGTNLTDLYVVAHAP